MYASIRLSLTVVALAAFPLTAQESTRKDRFGDDLPAGALARLGSVRLRSETAIGCLAFSPDGKSLVTAGMSNKVTFWDVATGKPSRTIDIPSSNVSALAFSRDGKVLALGCENSTVRLIDPQTGTEKRMLQDSLNRYSTITMSLSPDGSLVAMTHRYSRQVVVWSAQTGALRVRLTNVNTYNAPPPVFTPDNKHLLVLWSDGKLHLVDSATGKSVRALEPAGGPNVSVYAGRSVQVGLSPDGKQVVYRPSADRFFHAVDVDTAKEVRRWEKSSGSLYFHSGAGLAVTPNGRFVVEASGDGAVRVWGLASGKLLRELPSGGTSLTNLALSPDGKYAASAVGHVVFLWDVGEAQALHGSAGHQSSVTRLAFTPDGKKLLSLGTGTMRAWDPGTGNELFLCRPYSGYGIQNLVPSSDSRSVRWVASDRALYEWTLGQASPVRRTNPTRSTANYQSTALSPDGKALAGVTPTDRKLRLVNLLDNRPDRELLIVANPYNNLLTFSPDGRTLALSSTSDRVVTLFDVSTATEVRKLPPVGTNNPGSLIVSFAPDSRSLVKYDGELRVIETSTGGERARLPREPGAFFHQVAWSRNGRLIARAQADGVVAVHDTFTGQELFRRHTGQGSVYSVAFSPDGRRLATGGANTTILVWSLPEPMLPRLIPDETVAWADLANRDAGRAYQAIAYLSSHPAEAVRLFQAHLRPRPPVDAKRIDKLIEELDDDRFAVREKASEELGEMGPLAEAALKKATRNASLEVRRRAQDLLRKLGEGASVAPERLRARRAVEVLERIGTPAARDLLRNLLKKKLDSHLESSIQGSLERLGQ
jgi:WD40 repeat protein